MDKEINWQPEHFPAGTVIEMVNHGVDPETGEVVFSRSDKYPRLVTTVTHVTRSYPNNYCVIVEGPGVEMTSYGIMHDTYNFSHIGRVIKRGSGKVQWKEYKREPVSSKEMITRQLLAKDRYYWTSGSEPIRQILDSSLIPKTSMLNSGFFAFINEQTWVKKWELFPNYTVYHCRKKKLKAFIKQNINRFLMTAKEIERLAIEDQRQYDRLENENALAALDSDRQNSVPKVTKGTNDHGKPQDYLDGEEICGNCYVRYTNIGLGMDCEECQRQAVSDYHIPSGY